MAQATHLYFDHPYEPDPEERGFYWATRFTDTPKVFGFMPDDLYANIEVKRTGAPLTREEFCRTQDVCPDLMHTGNVVGMAAFLKKFSLPMGLYHNIFLLLNITEIKGRTIRRVMGGGGEFSCRRNFFSLSYSLYEFFLGHSMNIF